MKQVTDHVLCETRESPKLEPSTPLRREVHVKETRSGSAVRKVITWRTNKHEADAGYPPFVAFFTDYSPDRQEPLKTSLRVASTVERVDEIADEWLAENIKRGWRLVSRDIVFPAERPHPESAVPEAAILSDRKSAAAGDGKSVSISFARSASPSFSIVRKRLVSLAEHGQLAIEKDDHGREIIFSLTIGHGALVESARRTANLVRMVRGWKSAEFSIGDEPVKPIDFEALMFRLEDVDRCRREKARKGSVCSSACRLGCNQLSISPSHPFLDSFQSKQPWWTVGSFDGSKLAIDKKRLCRQITEPRNEPFRLCPNFNREAVIEKIMALPDIVFTGTEGWNIVYRREDGSSVWLWPVSHPLPFGLYEERHEKAFEQASAKEHGRTHDDLPRRNVPSVTYADVCGQDEAVEAVRDMVELPLTHADLFDQVGIHDAGGGIILAGPPGTGKTLLARAVAGESKAHIEIVAGPELLSKWFGESERQLRVIFHRAREFQPSVILFDELDGIAGNRNGDSYHRTFVAQLLTLLDGLEDRGRVFAIATTNRPQDIDPGLRRPGRFDRVIYMNLPNESGRKSLFDHHTKHMRLSPDLDTALLAAATSGFSGAQIAYVCRRAGVLCIKEAIREKIPNQDVVITMKHFLQAIEELRPSGSPGRSMELNQARSQRPVKDTINLSAASSPRS